jgi:hypothetical protein
VRGNTVVAVVEHGADQKLAENCRPTFVPRPDSGGGGEPAARADPLNDDPAGVDPELASMLDEPDESRIGVVERGGVRRFRGEAVTRQTR